MKRLLLIWIVLALFQTVAGQAKVNLSLPQLALKYLNERDYEKAAPLFRELSASGNNGYFRYYIQCLAELKQYEQAESDIRKEIRKERMPKGELLIELGFVLKKLKREDEAQEKYREAIGLVGKNRGSIINTATLFIVWSEYEMAEKVYDYAREILPDETFHDELVQVYLHLRNYDRLMEELLGMVRKNEAQLPYAQSILSSVMYLDFENGLRDEFRTIILKKIQADPSVIVYNRLLIWFFLQEKQFTAALRQSIALDRRTQKEEPEILGLAMTALNNHNYQDALTAYDYILAKGSGNPSYQQAYLYKMQAGYLNYLENETEDTLKGQLLGKQFSEALGILGYKPPFISLIRQYAHLLGFYLHEKDSAIRVLNRGISMPALRPEQTGQLKTELADIHVFSDDPWEATLIYSQVIDANRDNELGDEAKLKKAKLGYYLGNFSWAKAQLDVLKASTSKLTANDAMELALFISQNTTQDSLELPLQYFARADLLFFRNQDDQAMAVMDSISALFPYNSLNEDILFRKANIEIRRKRYTIAVDYLEKIVKEYSFELLADDALFLLADTYQFKLNEKEKAADAYKQILFSYPGSVYVNQARTIYRELTGRTDNEKPDEFSDKEKAFFKGTLHSP